MLNHSASPIHASGRLYFASREGEVCVLRAGRTFELLARNAIDGQLLASPVPIDGGLILRSDKALYRIGAGAGATR